MLPYPVVAASLGLWLVLIGCARLDAVLIGLGAVVFLLGMTELAEQFFEASE